MTIFNNNTRLLVFSPHPDDEILGCGGLIKKVKDSKGKIQVSLFTFGDNDKSNTRKNEFENVMKYMNVDSYECLFPNEYHLKLDKLPMFDLIQKIENAVNEFKPTICAIPFPSFNQDHKMIYDASIAALRSTPSLQRHLPQYTIIYEYPQVGWYSDRIHFTPNLYIDISKEIEDKVLAFELYNSQNKFREYSISSESIKIYAQMRGREITVDYAESFMIKRGILT